MSLAVRWVKRGAVATLLALYLAVPGVCLLLTIRLGGTDDVFVLPGLSLLHFGDGAIFLWPLVVMAGLFAGVEAWPRIAHRVTRENLSRALGSGMSLGEAWRRGWEPQVVRWSFGAFVATMLAMIWSSYVLLAPVAGLVAWLESQHPDDESWFLWMGLALLWGLLAHLCLCMGTLVVGLTCAGSVIEPVQATRRPRMDTLRWVVALMGLAAVVLGSRGATGAWGLAGVLFVLGVLLVAPLPDRLRSWVESTTLAVVGLAWLVMVFGMAGMLLYSLDDQDHQTSAVVARRVLPPGHQLRAGDLETTSRDTIAMGRDVFHREEQLIGATLASAVFAGEPVREARLSRVISETPRAVAEGERRVVVPSSATLDLGHAVDLVANGCVVTGGTVTGLRERPVPVGSFGDPLRYRPDQIEVAVPVGRLDTPTLRGLATEGLQGVPAGEGGEACP